jgi:hypothetical protein
MKELEEIDTVKDRVIHWVDKYWWVIILIIIFVPMLWLAFNTPDTPTPEPLPPIEELEKSIDTIYIERIETITKFKTKIINETIYINTADNSEQVIIRSNLTNAIDGYLQSR